MNSKISFLQVFLIAVLAMAVLLFESTLTRLLAVAQFYHFAFLVISLALIGFGASGTLLGIFPRFQQMPLNRLMFLTGVGFTIGIGISYAGISWLPFDSYRIAWESRQIIFFIFYYLALTIPFFVSGLGIGAALSISRGQSHVVYAANLIGSAFGALLAPLVISCAGVPGSVLFSACLGLFLAWIALGKIQFGYRKCWCWLLGGIFGLGLLSFGGMIAVNQNSSVPLDMRISPYKGLSYARLFPGAALQYSRWNAVSRVDVVANAGTRRFPGLSYQYLNNLPPQLGLSIDGDTLQPVILSTVDEFDVAAWMPEALAYDLYPDADVLVMEPGGGLGVFQALAGGAEAVTAVMENELIADAVAHTSLGYNVYSDKRVKLIGEPGRSFLHQSDNAFDLVVFPLTDPYRPVSSGAYSLAESYLLTVESFIDAFKALHPDGMLVATRWLQSPPSESARLITTLIEALNRQNIFDAENRLLAYRSIQTMTVLIKPVGWTHAELAKARNFVESRRFDWVWSPDLQDYEINRYNHLPAPEYYRFVQALFSTDDREGFYREYPYQISPVVDNRPFFFHFYTRKQTTEVLQTLGHIWQPFGGSGFLILVVLLIFVVFLSIVLVLLPMLWKQKSLGFFRSTPKTRWQIFGYFSFLGIAFLFVEIPLIQQFILVIGQPIYAFAVVVAVLLISSGIGSMLSKKPWIRKRLVFSVLTGSIVVTTLTMHLLVNLVLFWPLWGRVVAAIIALFPIGLLMGMPFPLGLGKLEKEYHLKSWAWAINGCSSVIASVLAAILTLSFGYNLVLLLGAVSYLSAGFIGEH